MAKSDELRDMSDEQIGLTLKDAVDKLFRLKIQSQTERLDAPSEIAAESPARGPHQDNPKPTSQEGGRRRARRRFRRTS